MRRLVILSRADGEGPVNSRQCSRTCGSFAALTMMALALLLAAPALAQSIAPTSCGTVVAHDGVVELLGCASASWKSGGVDFPGAIAVSATKAVVLDPLASVAVVADLKSGRTTQLVTAETPIDAAFVGADLFILARDARLLERIDARGAKKSVAVGADPQYLRVANGKLYVLSRIEGRLQEIAPESLRVVRETKLAPFASDIEIDNHHLYAVYPGEGMLRTYRLDSLQLLREVRTGAVPVDIALGAEANVVTARVLAVADPSSKRVWMTEGAQSSGEAFGRGFLRGFLGLGLFGGRDSSFPTGVDRVAARGQKSVAYDSSSGTLYRLLPRGKSARLAAGIAPRAFAVTASGAVWWDGKALQSAKF